ncbi:MAG: SBBP repeat-containing protein, partial [Legionellales bacterium]
MKSLYLLICSLLCLVAVAVNAQNTLPSGKEKQVNLAHAGFYENKGQITDQNYMPNRGVKYLLSSPGFNVQLRQTGFSYDTYTDSEITALPSVDSQQLHVVKGKEQPENFIRHYHRVDIELVGCNTNAQLTTEGRSDDYYNYFTAGAPQGGVSEVHYYSKITYKDIYPHIDLEFLSSGSLKPVEYNFIVHAGGNPAEIKLEYKGANKVNLIDNKLLVSVTAGDFTESIPSSYFKDTKQHVEIHYAALGNNTYGFSIRNSPFTILNSSSDLIIDPKPNLVWGTYYGGTGSNNGSGTAIALDASGNVYITGNTQSSSGIATAGAYQTTYGTNTNAFVAKFNSAGTTLLWGTYYGGAGPDYGTGIALDASGNVYITGYTSSTSGIATTGAYQTTNAGTETFVAKFNSAGTILLWGTYYGGGGNDYASSITLDASD